MSKNLQNSRSYILSKQCTINSLWESVKHSFLGIVLLKAIKKKLMERSQVKPQSPTAANLRQQEEQKKDKNIHAQNKRTHVQEAQRPAPFSPSEVIRC